MDTITLYTYIRVYIIGTRNRIYFIENLASHEFPRLSRHLFWHAILFSTCSIQYLFFYPEITNILYNIHTRASQSRSKANKTIVIHIFFPHQSIRSYQFSRFTKNYTLSFANLSIHHRFRPVIFKPVHLLQMYEAVCYFERKFVAKMWVKKMKRRNSYSDVKKLNKKECSKYLKNFLVIMKSDYFSNSPERRFLLFMSRFHVALKFRKIVTKTRKICFRRNDNYERPSRCPSYAEVSVSGSYDVNYTKSSTSGPWKISLRRKKFPGWSGQQHPIVRWVIVL